MLFDFKWCKKPTLCTRANASAVLTMILVPVAWTRIMFSFKTALEMLSKLPHLRKTAWSGDKAYPSCTCQKEQEDQGGRQACSRWEPCECGSRVETAALELFYNNVHAVVHPQVARTVTATTEINWLSRYLLRVNFLINPLINWQIRRMPLCYWTAKLNAKFKMKNYASS